MRKLKLFFACLLMAVLSMGQVWATEAEYVITSQTLNVTLNGEESTAWTINSGSFGNYDATKGAQTTAASFQITCPETYSNVTSIVVYYSTNNKSTALIAAAVGNQEANQQQVEKSKTNSSLTFSFSDAGDDKTISLSYSKNGNAGSLYIKKIVVTYTDGEGTQKPTACAEPTFDPEAGAVVSGTTVALTTTTEDADIYYTMGDSPADPTTSSTKYTAPISITEATTIKAIAVKEGMDNSSVATATYTIIPKLTSLQAVYDKAAEVGNTATDVYITFNDWKISGVKNKNAFLTDGTNGAVIYSTSNSEFVVNNVLSGTVACKVQLFNGFAEITSLIPTTPELTVTSGLALTPVVKTLDQLSAVNTGALVTLENLTYDGTQLSDGVNTIKTYTTFYNASLVSGKKYNITGVYQYYQSAGQILPRSIDDIEEVTEAGAPEAPAFTPTPDTYTEAKSVSIATTTDGAVVYYTMTNDGSDPATPDTDDDSQLYSSAISLSANGTYKFKAVAFKDGLESAVVTATYVINIPLPSHVFDVTHTFTEAAGEVDFKGWSGSYAEHTFNFTNDNVIFASGSKQTSTITDRPVVRNTAVSLVLTNSAKMITAVRFDYKQWGTKTQTLTMMYSTDGGANYSDFEPALTATNFAIQALDLPEGVNAIRVIGSENNQAGLTSIAFDLENKPVVTKTVTITTPSNGTLVVKNAGGAITSGDAIEVGTTLTIEATPNEGYSLSGVTVNGNAYTEATLTLTENVTIAATFVEDVRPAASLKLWENGNEVAYPGDYKQNDHVALPTTVSHECAGRVFVGWSAVEVAQTDVKPAYLEPGADFTLSAAGVNNLYAVYAAVATPAGYQKLESNAFETTATYVIGAEQLSTDATMWYFSSYSGTDSNINWGVMTKAPETTALVEFTLSGTASELVAQDAAGNYLAGLNTGKFKMSSTSTTVALSAEGVIGTTNSFVLRHNYNGGNGGLRWYDGTTGTQAYFYKVVSATYNKYSTTCDAAIDAPIFNVAEGTYQEAQFVLIDNYDGNYIYVYTTDNSEPTIDSNLDPKGTGVLYGNNEGIEIHASCTLKARAYDLYGNYSDVTSATYTINLSLPTMTWYTSDAKTATIAANATYTINKDAEFAPVFETNSTGALTYSSSDPTIAEINETTGALTLKGVTGTTFIKCEVAAAGDYTAGEQGFTLHVREAVTVDNVVIVAQYGGKWYAMKNTFTSDKMAASMEVTYADGKIWDLPTADQEAITWVRTVDGDNVTFQAPNGNYLKTSSNDLALEAGENGIYQWNWNSTYYRTGTQERTFMYREAYNFRSYAVSNAGNEGYSALPVVTAAVFATTPPTPVLTDVRTGLTAGNYYTICYPKAMKNIQGATLWSFIGKDTEFAYLVEETATTIDAGKPYILYATASTVQAVLEGEDAVAAGTNGAIHGTFSLMDQDALNAAAAAAGHDLYLVIGNQLRQATGVPGTTVNNSLPANRAYVILDVIPDGKPASAPGRNVRSMPMHKNAATGMDELNASEAPRKMIIDGKMYIFRGEKMYNANGQLVK